MYSVVEGKSIAEINPKTTDQVHVKDNNGTWEGIVYTSGMFHLRELSLCQKYINTYSVIFQLLTLTCILIPINYDFLVLINYLTEWIVYYW